MCRHGSAAVPFSKTDKIKTSENIPLLSHVSGTKGVKGTISDRIQLNFKY